MVDQGIKPVYVFDGKPPQMKSGEVCVITENGDCIALLGYMIISHCKACCVCLCPLCFFVFTPQLSNIMSWDEK